jgi:transposase-like protein
MTRYCPDCGDRLLSYLFSGEGQPRYACPTCQEGK